MEDTKCREQFVFVDTYHCHYISTVIWIFYLGIKFQKDLFLQFFYDRKKCEIKRPKKLSTNKVHFTPGDSRAKQLKHWTCNVESLSSSPPLNTTWICS